MSPSRLLLIFPRSRHPDLQCLKKRVKSPNGEHTAPSSSETPHNWSWAQTVFPLIWSNGVLTFFFSLHQKMLTHERLSSLKHWKKKMQLTSWPGMLANSLSRKVFHMSPFWELRMGIYSTWAESLRASLQVLTIPTSSPLCRGSFQNAPVPQDHVPSQG